MGSRSFFTNFLTTPRICKKGFDATERHNTSVETEMNLILQTATATLFGVALSHGAFAAGKLEVGGNVNQEAFVEESASVAIGEDATSVQGANIACNAEIGGDLNSAHHENNMTW